MPSSENKELKINQHLDNIDDWMENGPPDDSVTPAQFIRDLVNEGRALVSALEALTEADVDEIWQEDEEGVEA